MLGFSYLKGNGPFPLRLLPYCFLVLVLYLLFSSKTHQEASIRQVSLLLLLTVTCTRPSTPSPQSKETVWSRSPVTPHGLV